MTPPLLEQYPCRNSDNTIKTSLLGYTHTMSMGCLVDAVRNHVENVAGDDTGGDGGGQPVAGLMSAEPVAHPSDLLAGLSIE